jgi:hypothetical protein
MAARHHQASEREPGGTGSGLARSSHVCLLYFVFAFLVHCRDGAAIMDRNDLELLDKQMAHISPAPRNNGVLIVAIAAVFFAGVAFGGVLFANQGEPPLQTASVAGSATMLP